MADTNITVRADEAIKEQFERLAQESGIGKKDFMRALIDTYELNQTKISVPVMEHDIAEIQQLTSRINNIFINTGERFKMWEDQQIQNARQELDAKQGDIDLLQKQVVSLQADVEHAEERVNSFREETESAKGRADELEEKVNQLQDINAKNDALIQSYKEKNEQLTAEIKNLQPMAEINSGLRSENDLLRQSLEDAKKDITALQNKLSVKETEFENKLRSASEQLTDTLTFQKDKAILDLRVQHQSEITELQERHAEKINSLLQKRENDLESRKKKPSIIGELQTAAQSPKPVTAAAQKKDKSHEL